MIRYVILLSMIAWVLIVLEQAVGPGPVVVVLSVALLGLLGYALALLRLWLLGEAVEEEEEDEEEFDVDEEEVEFKVPAILHCAHCGFIEVIHVLPSSMSAECPHCSVVNFVSHGRDNN